MHAIEQFSMFERQHGELLATQIQLAAIFGVAASTVSRWTIRPVSRVGKVALYSVREAIQYRLASDGRLDLQAERARLAQAQADRAQLDNACRARSLIAADIALDVFAAQVSAAKNKLIGMGTKLSPELCAACGVQTSAAAAAIEEIIDLEIREILEELSVDDAARDIDVEGAGRGD